MRGLTKVLCGLFAIAALMSTASAQDAGYTIKPGDTLRVSVWKEPELTGPVLVQPDGGLSFPLVGQIDTKGKNSGQVQQLMVERLKKFIPDPVVTVALQEVRGNKVYVLGQVAKPGEFVMNPSVDVMQAISMAGGTTPFAKKDDIVILRRTGTAQQALPFRYGEVERGRNLQQNIILQAGDIVVVP